MHAWPYSAERLLLANYKTMSIFSSGFHYVMWTGMRRHQSQLEKTLVNLNIHMPVLVMYEKMVKTTFCIKKAKYVTTTIKPAVNHQKHFEITK